MRTKHAEAKVRSGKGGEMKVVWSGDYSYPENLEEAIEVDGEDKVMKVYLMERYTNFLDARRREATTNAIPKVLLDKVKDAWKKGDKAKLELICETLDLTMEELGSIAE